MDDKCVRCSFIIRYFFNAVQRCVSFSLAFLTSGLSYQLDKATDFEERRIIRAALRDLMKKKRGSHNNIFITSLMLCLISDFSVSHQRNGIKSEG